MNSYVEKLYKSAPPTVDCNYTRKELNSLGAFNLMSLSGLLTEVRCGLRDSTILSTEIQLIRVLIYKVQAVLRNDKHLAPLTKVRRCVRRVMEMQLPESAEQLNRRLKSAYQPSNVALKSDVEREIRLPSRQAFEFVQVQIQAMCLLIVCTLKTICQAHKCGLQKITLAHFIPINIIMSSTLARLWVLFKAYLLKCIQLYQHMLPLTRILKGTNTDWFPKSEKFPVDLSDWLGVDSLEEIRDDQ